MTETDTETDTDTDTRPERPALSALLS